METTGISGAGMSSLVAGAIKDTTGLNVINKTLSKNQEAQQQSGASMAISVNDALGKGTRLDINV